jgi:hypothetical protein
LVQPETFNCCSIELSQPGAVLTTNIEYKLIQDFFNKYFFLVIYLPYLYKNLNQFKTNPQLGS